MMKTANPVKRKVYTVMTTTQVIAASLLIGTIAGSISALNSVYQEHKRLPIVKIDANENCVKVINRENGHAFNCNDVGLVLRQYRTQESPAENEKLSTSPLQ